MKVQFGSGGLNLPGWLNHDAEVDIRQRLPYADSSVDFIYTSHVIEHLTPCQAWHFLEECHRILVDGGVVRIAFPDISQISYEATFGRAQEYLRVASKEGTLRAAVKAVLCSHGHQSVWNVELLTDTLRVMDLSPAICKVGESEHPDLCNLEQHGKVVGEEVARTETSVVEGMK